MTIPQDNAFPLSRIQKLIGRLMQESKLNCPSSYIETWADVTRLLEIRKPYCKKVGIRVTTNDFFICAIARSISRFPLMAGKVDSTGEFIDIPEHIGVGFAVAAPHGLVVPVIQDIGNKSLTHIAQDSNALLNKARSNKLTPEDLDGENVVLSGLGMFGITQFLAIAPPNATGIISIGNINDTISPGSDGFIVRKKMSVSLAFNNRTVDSIYAAQFLQFVSHQIENPIELTD